MSKKIVIRCKGATTLDPTMLKDFQGNLKSLTNEDYLRLKKQVEDLGFSEPISVWKNGKNYFILNGHQRLRTIQKMMEDGYECPPLPCNLIDAKTKEEAKRKLLALTSQYGKIERQGLYEFLQDTDIKPEELFTNFRFPEIDLPSFTEEFFVDKVPDPLDMGGTSLDDLPPNTAPLGDGTAPSHVKMVQLFFNEETHPEFISYCDELQERYGPENITDTVMKAVRFSHENDKAKTKVRVRKASGEARV